MGDEDWLMVLLRTAAPSQGELNSALFHAAAACGRVGIGALLQSHGADVAFDNRAVLRNALLYENTEFATWANGGEVADPWGVI